MTKDCRVNGSDWSPVKTRISGYKEVERVNAMNFLEWLLQPLFAVLTRIEESLARIEKNQEALMATYQEAKQAWVDYTKALQDENAELRQALTDAQAAAQANAEALAQFQADDAATDAQQLADAAQAIADDLSSTLDGLKNPPVEPEPLPEPDPGTGELPVEPEPTPDPDAPYVDNTLPGDLPPDEEESSFPQ